MGREYDGPADCTKLIAFLDKVGDPPYYQWSVGVEESDRDGEVSLWEELHTGDSHSHYIAEREMLEMLDKELSERKVSTYQVIEDGRTRGGACWAQYMTQREKEKAT